MLIGWRATLWAILRVKHAVLFRDFFQGVDARTPESALDKSEEAVCLSHPIHLDEEFNLIKHAVAMAEGLNVGERGECN